MDNKEFALRLIAILVLFAITVVNSLYWRIDHTFLLYIGALIGLLAGIKLPKRLVGDIEGGR